MKVYNISLEVVSIIVNRTRTQLAPAETATFLNQYNQEVISEVNKHSGKLVCSWADNNQHLAILDSAASIAGATQVMAVSGMTSDDTVISVDVKTKGANAASVISFARHAGGTSLDIVFSADPGIGAVLAVGLLRDIAPTS